MKKYLLEQESVYGLFALFFNELVMLITSYLLENIKYLCQKSYDKGLIGGKSHDAIACKLWSFVVFWCEKLTIKTDTKKYLLNDKNLKDLSNG